MNNDQGFDGAIGSTNSMNAVDAFGYSLHYFDNDYQARFSNSISEIPSNSS